MKHDTVIALDLAKFSFQACIIKRDKPVSNRAYTRKQLTTSLAKQPPCVVAMEACGSAHYWARTVEQMGHTPVIIAPRNVKAYRTGHKTDHNDALAVAAALRSPNLKTVAPKSVEQQGLQGVERIREHLQKERTALGNLLQALVFEFGITIAKGIAGLRNAMPLILEEADNGLPDSLRPELARQWEAYLALAEELQALEKRRDRLIQQHPSCIKLMQLEGVGPVNALHLYLALGSNGSNFASGREAAACIGVTPRQHSTGGKVVLLGIGKRWGKQSRSSLIQGARSVLQKLDKREAVNQKEAWLKALIKRRGFGIASVALANKTVRTAWALLHHGKEYHRPASLLIE